MQYLDVIPLNSIPLDKPQIYTYSYPSTNSIIPGCLVDIPLYRKQTKGLISAVYNKKPKELEGKNIRNINSLILPYPIIQIWQLDLIKWLSEYYVCPLGLVASRLIPQLPSRPESTLLPPLFNRKKSGKPRRQIIQSAATGRFDQYKKAIRETARKGEQIIYLVPEASLLEQTLDMAAELLDKTEITELHGSLTPKTYWRNWQKILTGQNKLILGTRQAIYAPMPFPGLIILDDEHSASYKQWAMQPRYDARTAAYKISELTGADIIFGSAAPSITTKYHLAPKNNKITERKHHSTAIQITDMRAELRSGNYSIFSHQLNQNLEQILAKNEQALLFVPRRAASRFLLCRDCGHIITCPNCQISLIEYSSQQLICTHCEHREPSPVKCPACGSPRIKGFGTGSQKVAAEANNLFPHSRIVIFDQDHIKTAKELKRAYQELNTGQIDILVGTQMALGLTSPFLSLAAAVTIDPLLGLPDWRAEEKTLGLLSSLNDSVALHNKANIIIQTYNPERHLLLEFQSGDYPGSFKRQLRERQDLAYPPFSELVKLEYRDQDKNRGKQTAFDTKNELLNSLPAVLRDHTEILGPKPALVPKIKNKYIWQLIIKIKKDRPLLPDFWRLERLSWLAALSQDWFVDVEADDLL